MHEVDRNEDFEKIDVIETTFKTNLVYTKNGRDIFNNHEYEEMNILVSLFYLSNIIDKVTIKSFWCKECNAFFIDSGTYLELKRRGNILCQIFNEQEFMKYMINSTSR